MDGGTVATATLSHSHHLKSPLCHAPSSHLPPNVDIHVLPPPPTAARQRQHPDIIITPPTRHRPSTLPFVTHTPPTSHLMLIVASSPLLSCNARCDEGSAF